MMASSRNCVWLRALSVQSSWEITDPGVEAWKGTIFCWRGVLVEPDMTTCAGTVCRPEEMRAGVSLQNIKN